MMPFFTPSAWEGCSEAINFTHTKSRQINGDSSKTPATEKKRKKKNNKKQRKNKSQTNATTPPFQGRGPLAPPLLLNSDADSDDGSDDSDRMQHKIKSGRIEKPKNAKQQQQQQKKLKLTPALAKAATESIASMAVDNETAPAPNSLAAKLKAELMGGRFRYLNEQLYTMNSGKAEKLFKQDQAAFAAYHEGYRHQVEKWPFNPLQRIIKTIKRLPKTHEIGDFGCGEGKLAQSVPNKVYSMDLVAARPDIIACDIANTPMQPQSLDIAVYCLSLMGTNLNDFFLETNRVLKLHGSVYIAEIQSRFDDVRQFVRALSACGFDLIKKDVTVNYFIFFHFKKMRHVGKVAKLQPFSLKPCLYRKR